ncbi:MAG: hypothetical protein JXA95_03375 [Spirochaetales bacterium]|nr:hypothetical protein [Spirochaetales bacterium]
MKRVFLLISLLLSFSLLFAQTDGAGETLFQFSLYQGDRYVPLEGETFPLERLPFQIEMHLPEGQYVYVNFSRSDELYRAVRENRDFEEVLGFGGTGMAERYGNPDRKIILNDEGWHVWRVNGSEDNRFNSTFRKKGDSLAIRRVEYIWEMGPNGPMPLEFGDLDDIYCVVCGVTPLENWEYRADAVQAFHLHFP